MARVTTEYNTVYRANASQAKAEVASYAATMTAMTTNFKLLMSGMLAVTKLAMVGFLGVTAAGIGSIAIANEFNKSLVHAAAIGQLTTQEMNNLGEEILRLSVRYGQSANNIAEGVVVLTKAGLTTAEISESIDSITQAMLANSISFEQAANIAIFAVKQFGGEEGFGALPKLMDQMQKVTQETVLDFAELQDGLQYAGSSALLANVPVEQLLASLGALSQRAMESGIAARSLNRMMLALVENTDEMQAWIDEMGLGVQVIKDGKLNIDELIRSFGELNFTIEDLQRSGDIFSIRALRSWGLLVTGADEYIKLLNMVKESQGTLQDVFLRQTEKLSFQIAQIGAIFTAPYKTPTFMNEMKKLLEGLREPAMEISEALAKGMWNFLQWTLANKDKLVGFFKRFLEWAFELLGPLYNLGKMMVDFGKNTFFVVTAFFTLKKLNVFTMMSNYYRSLKMVTAVSLDNAKATEMIAVAQQHTTFAWQTWQKKGMTYVMTNQMIGNSLLSLASAAMGVGMGAYFMGRVFGKEMLGMAAVTITLTSLMAGLQAAIAAPPGFKLAAFFGTSAALALAGGAMYAVGMSQYEEMERPSLEGWESIKGEFFNPDYTAAPVWGTGNVINNYNIQGTLVQESDLNDLNSRTDNESAYG